MKNRLNRLNKLEQTKRKIATEADCICFPPNEPPRLLLQAERDAVSAVLCPVHGERVRSFAGPLIYGEIILPLHLDLHWRTRHSPQYAKAMDASFPSDRWPAMKVVGTGWGCAIRAEGRDRDSSVTPATSDIGVQATS